MKVLAPRDAGLRLNLTTSRLAQLDREGVLPAIRDSAGRRFYDPDVIERPAHEREARRARSAGDVQSARGREVDRNPKKSAPAGTLA